jgi:hypothetical protein
MSQSNPNSLVRAAASSLDSQLFEASPDCVKLLDLSGHIVAMNKNGQCVMEVDDISEIFGKNLATLWPSERPPHRSGAGTAWIGPIAPADRYDDPVDACKTARTELTDAEYSCHRVC